MSAPGTVPPQSSPSRHLLVLIIDALQLPPPARTPADEAAHLTLLSRRAGHVVEACRRAVASPGDGGLANAARDLYEATGSLPATGYRHAADREVPR